MNLINQELVKIRAYLPEKLAKLSISNSQLALDLIQHWGNGTKPLRELWDLANEGLVKEELNENQSSRVVSITG